MLDIGGCTLLRNGSLGVCKELGCSVATGSVQFGNEVAGIAGGGYGGTYTWEGVSGRELECGGGTL